MATQLLIAGGGIGGMAAALAAGRAGWDVRLFERAETFGEVGAGIQIGPNVVRILESWGLGPALEQVAFFPERLQVRDAVSGRELGVLPLGERAVRRYGARYATIHRADMHQLLLDAVRRDGHAKLHLGSWLASFSESRDAVSVRLTTGLEIEGDALVGADGLWSRVRGLLLNDGSPRVTGHLAFRATVPMASLPAQLRSRQVTAWLGPDMHVVEYPVRAGESLNVVAIVHGQLEDDLENWDHATQAGRLHAALGLISAPLRERVHAVTSWRLWALCDRAPMRSADEQARGLVALLGDAAHPMRPYLAQGAGMAIEDAAELSQVLAMTALDVRGRLRRYALNRWQRCARVQAQSIRNGVIFHARGPLRWGRDASMRLLGERLMDVPWLYQGSR